MNPLQTSIAGLRKGYLAFIIGWAIATYPDFLLKTISIMMGPGFSLGHMPGQMYLFLVLFILGSALAIYGLYQVTLCYKELAKNVDSQSAESINKYLIMGTYIIAGGIALSVVFSFFYSGILEPIIRCVAFIGGYGCLYLGFNELKKLGTFKGEGLGGLNDLIYSAICAAAAYLLGEVLVFDLGMGGQVPFGYLFALPLYTLQLVFLFNGWKRIENSVK